MEEPSRYEPPILRAAKAFVDYLERPKPERRHRPRMTEERKSAIMAAAVASCCAISGFGSVELYELQHANDLEA